MDEFSYKGWDVWSVKGTYYAINQVNDTELEGRTINEIEAAIDSEGAAEIEWQNDLQENR